LLLNYYLLFEYFRMVKEVEHKKKGVYKNLISGGLSAAFARTVINPIERLEILRQVGNADYKGLGMGQAFIKFYKTQGVQGLFKGNSAALVRVFPFSAIEFYSFEFYKNIFIRGRAERQNSIKYTLLCGTLTGLNAITLTFPLDVARTRLACHTEHSDIKESSLIKTLVQLYQNEGLRGLFKGYTVTFLVNGKFYFKYF
jgi:solute carrier family 25 phosphate transporter 23/24/25/41